MEERRSQQQHLRRIRSCDEAELEGFLVAAAKEFPGACSRVALLLCQERSFCLSAACSKVAKAGFHVQNYGFVNQSNFQQKMTTLTPECFDFALGMWKRLDSNTQNWFSERLMTCWRSPQGATLPSDWLKKMKCIWQQVAPTVNQKISANRACGLGWSPEETEELLKTHVDLTGDTTELVRELLKRDLLSTSLLQQQGLLAGLLLVDPKLAAEKLLSGEVSLEKPQATVARLTAGVLASQSEELTKQNVKHLFRFVKTVAGDLSQAPNAKHQMIDSFISMVPKLSLPQDRQDFVKSVSGLYVTGAGGGSTLAEVPHPEREGPRQRRQLEIGSFKVFMEKALTCLDLEEVTNAMKNCKFESSGLCDKLHSWALEQLDTKQKTTTLLKFLESWIAPLCQPDQVLSFWMKAVDVVGSWSFLWSSLPTAAPACGKDMRMYDRVLELLALEPRAEPTRVEALRQRLLETFGPERLVADEGISAWFALRKRPRADLQFVSRETHKLAEGAQEINDHMQPEQELLRVLAKHPVMHKTKTKEEFDLLSNWVQNLDTRLFCNAEVAESLSQMLCEKWSDKGFLSYLCGTFIYKLLECLPITKDCSALVKFVAKCPNLGNKQDALLPHLSRYSTFEPDKVYLSALHPLLAATCTRTTYLVSMLHALKVKEVTGETQKLFYELLGKEESPASQMRWLMSCAFTTPPADFALDECIDGVAWCEAELLPQPATIPYVEPPSRAERAAKLLAEPRLEWDSLYRHFGPSGLALVQAFLRTATPLQLCELLSNCVPFRDLVRTALDCWKPQRCAPEQVSELLSVMAWFPEVYSRCAPLVWAAGEEHHVRSLLALTWQVGQEQLRVPPDLSVLPKKWWHCLHWESAGDADIAAVLRAGVSVPLEEVCFAQRSEETQGLLLDAHGENLDNLANFAPKILGPLEPYLERIFELVPSHSKQLILAGDGIEDEERLNSGWNKLVNRLLLGLRTRMQEGNPLHTEEQLLLFKGCLSQKCDNSNSSLLADFMEAKLIDPLHIASLVTLVLNARGFNHTVRDSALRAMMRLPKEDRDALHRSLLEKAGEKGLELQTLFSLVVTQLDDSVLPLVRQNLAKLTLEQWGELLALVKDANPSGGRDPHTFPRSLCPEFQERFFLRYLVDAPEKREPRYFLLFVACTEKAEIPKFILDVLRAQRHALDPLFRAALTDFSLEEFREILEFFTPEEWLKKATTDWVLTRVHEGESQSCARLRVVLDVLSHPVFKGSFIELVKVILQSTQAATMLKSAPVRDLLFERLPKVSKEPRGEDTWNNRALRVIYFRECWLAGARFTAATLETELGITEHRPLQRTEVQQLGVDMAAYKLLMEMAPDTALPLFGLRILEEEAAFAKSLSMQQLRAIPQLWSHDDAHWATCRKVIAEVVATSALPLAVQLFKHSRELRDLDLVANAYQAVDNFTRKQTWLPLEFSQLWEKFGHAIQTKVIDPVVPPQQGISLEVSRVQQLSRSPSTSSWEVVMETSC